MLKSKKKTQLSTIAYNKKIGIGNDGNVRKWVLLFGNYCNKCKYCHWTCLVDWFVFRSVVTIMIKTIACMIKDRCHCGCLLHHANRYLAAKQRIYDQTRFRCYTKRKKNKKHWPSYSMSQITYMHRFSNVKKVNGTVQCQKCECVHKQKLMDTLKS